MPLEPLRFFDSNRAESNAIYTRILSFLDPHSFLEALTLSDFLSIYPDPAKEASHNLACALDEIKQAGADVFAQEHYCLTAKVETMTGGLTNACFKLKTPKGNYFLRIPGKGSEEHLSRDHEAYNVKVAHELGFNIEIFFFNPKTGLYVGEFINESQPLTRTLLEHKQTMQDVAVILKTLHTSTKKFINDIDIFTRLRNLMQHIEGYDHRLLYDKADLLQKLQKLGEICAQDRSELVACHNDT
ncbi:MAG: hypothetical protein ACHP65_09890, partial [Legionellales bacterium]